MIKKCDLQKSFENYVQFVKSVVSSVGQLKVLTWLITLDESSKSIRLNAVTEFGMVCVLRSYPFRSVTSAYQFMVRL